MTVSMRGSFSRVRRRLISMPSSAGNSFLISFLPVGSFGSGKVTVTGFSSPVMRSTGASM